MKLMMMIGGGRGRGRCTLRSRVALLALALFVAPALAALVLADPAPGTEFLAKGTLTPAPHTIVDAPVIEEVDSLPENHILFGRTETSRRSSDDNEPLMHAPSPKRQQQQDGSSSSSNSDDPRFRMPLPDAESYSRMRDFVRGRVQDEAAVDHDVVIGYDVEKREAIKADVDWTMLKEEVDQGEHEEALAFFESIVHRNRRAACFINSPPSSGCSAESLVYRASEIRPFVVKIIFNTPSGLNMCSGTLFDEDDYVLTASHCVYDTSNSQFYDQFEIVPAMEDRVFPFSSLTTNDYFGMERPFGTALVSQIYVYPGYTTQGYSTSDQTLLRLDRPIGARTGVLSPSTATHSHVNNNGYPGESPHSGHLMYNRFAPIGFQECGGTSLIFRSDHDAYGGDSGSGAFAVVGGTKYLFGNLYAGPRPCPNYYVRLTSTKLNYWRDIMSNAPSPSNKPQIIEFVNLDGAEKNISTPAASNGEAFTVRFGLYNVGFASGTATVTIAYDAFEEATGSETQILSPFTVTLSANQATIIERELTITGAAQGIYYVKALWSTSPTQYDDLYNYVTIGQLIVTDEPCARFSGCDSCVAQAGCGQCDNSFCWRGTSSGANGAFCNSWSYFASDCDDPCAQYTTCNQCTQFNGCGWCGTSGMCTSGVRGRPSEGTCGDWDWYDIHCNAPLDPLAPPHSASTTDSSARATLASLIPTIALAILAAVAALIL